MALTAAARHLGPQLSPLVSRTLPGVAPPTTWVARMSFYPPKQRMRCVSGFAFSQSARRHTLPNRVRFTAHRQFASGCSPPRFAATQLPSTTGSWLTPTWTLTMLCTRLHGRTRSPPPWAMGVEHALKTIAHRVGSYEKAIPFMLFKTSRRRINKTDFHHPSRQRVSAGAKPVQTRA
jgi:hypothetical protein